MITKYTSGTPIRTDAVVKDFAGIDINKFPVDYKIIDGKFIFSFDMQDSDIVFGLGEAPRGINKRGWIYESFCSDDPFHTETKSSLYAAHNFLMLNGSKTFGILLISPRKSVGTSVTQNQAAQKSLLKVQILTSTLSKTRAISRLTL